MSVQKTSLRVFSKVMSRLKTGVLSKERFLDVNAGAMFA